MSVYIEAQADRLIELRDLIKGIQTEEKELKAMLSKHMDRYDMTVLKCDRGALAYQEVETKRLDTKQVRADHGERYDVESSYHKLTVIR